MNKERRKALEDICTNLVNLNNELDILRDEEQKYFDNMPESLQGGDKGTQAEETVSYLEDASSGIQEAISAIESAC